MNSGRLRPPRARKAPGFKQVKKETNGNLRWLFFFFFFFLIFLNCAFQNLRRRYDELESAISLMRSDLANVTALFETTKKAHTKLQRENATTVAELGETKRSLDVTKGELTEAKTEARGCRPYVDATPRDTISRST